MNAAIMPEEFKKKGCQYYGFCFRKRAKKWTVSAVMTWFTTQNHHKRYDCLLHMKQKLMYRDNKCLFDNMKVYKIEHPTLPFKTTIAVCWYLIYAVWVWPLSN